jgi:hypothetical protein
VAKSTRNQQFFAQTQRRFEKAVLPLTPSGNTTQHHSFTYIAVLFPNLGGQRRIKVVLRSGPDGNGQHGNESGVNCVFQYHFSCSAKFTRVDLVTICCRVPAVLGTIHTKQAWSAQFRRIFCRNPSTRCCLMTSPNRQNLCCCCLDCVAPWYDVALPSVGMYTLIALMQIRWFGCAAAG